MEALNSGNFASEAEQQIATTELLARAQEEALAQVTGSMQNYAEIAGNAFSGVPDATQLSMEQMIDNLQNNQDELATWSENLGIIASSGISADFVAELEAMGLAGRDTVAEIAANIAKDMEDGILDGFDAEGNEVLSGDLIELLDNTAAVTEDATQNRYGEMGDQLVNTIVEKFGENAELESAAASLVETAFANVDTDTLPIGQNLSQGVIDGVTSMLTAVEEVSELLGIASLSPLKLFLQIASPSKATEEIGKNAGEGLRLGILGSAEAVSNTAANLAKIAQSGLEGELSKFNDIGRQMMEGVESGIRRGESGVINAATRVAKAAAQAVRDILKIKSPSKVMEEIGKQTWEGFIQGMDEELDAVITKSQEIAAEAVKAVDEEIQKIRDELDQRTKEKEKEREKERLKEFKKAVADAEKELANAKKNEKRKRVSLRLARARLILNFNYGLL